ncbi:MAG TPA: hypothetical protein VF389_03325 [Woeseiaceae bacterium]
MTSSNPDPNRRSAGNMPDDAGNGSTKQKIKDEARDAKRELGTKAREKAEVGQHRLAEGADALSDAIDAAASNLDEQDRDGLARYARELSSNLASAAGQLEGRSVDELANDAKRLARNNPALFMLGSIAVGFGLSRFFKASSERDHHKDDNAFRANADRSNDAFQDDYVSTGTPVQRRERNTTETNTTSTATRSGNGRELI